jgi:cytochrome P450
MDVQWSLLLTKYGEPWRLRRKIAERGFCPGSLAAYRAIQETRARVLTTRLLQNPQEWTAHIELSGDFPFLFPFRSLISFSQFPRRTAPSHDIRLRGQRAS